MTFFAATLYAVFVAPVVTLVERIVATVVHLGLYATEHPVVAFAAPLALLLLLTLLTRWEDRLRSKP